MGKSTNGRATKPSDDELEVYRQLAAQVRNEINEYHRIQAFFVILLASLSGFIEVVGSPHRAIYVVGALLSAVWFVVHCRVVEWRDSWMGKLAKVEKKLWPRKPDYHVYGAALEADPRFDPLKPKSWRRNLDTCFALLSVLSFLGFAVLSIIR